MNLYWTQYESIQGGDTVYESIQAELTEIYDAGKWNSMKRFVAAKNKIRDLLDTETVDPLDLVCSVPEAALRLGIGEVQVRRKIYDGTLRARKSHGAWLVAIT